MKKPFAFVLTLALMVVSVLPGVRPVPSYTALASALLPPTISTPLPASEEPEAGSEPSHALPLPGDLPPEVEEARARQAMEAVLEKYLQHFAPDREAGPIEVTLDGDWAYGVAPSQGRVDAFGGPTHILAHRLPQGLWQALMPSEEGLYLQWVDAMPERLISGGDKVQLRAQAAEADALRQPRPTSAAPTLSVEGISNELVEFFPRLLQPPVMPIPRIQQSVSFADTAVSLLSSVSIPYISQYQGQNTQNHDCGPASGAMVLQAYGKRPDGLTDRDWVVQVRSHSGNSSGDLNFSQLEAAISWYQVGSTEIPPTLSPPPDAQMQEMKNALAANKPVIALVHGATLGRGSAYGDHFVVVRGFSDDGQSVYVNDPDYRSPCPPDWLECGGEVTWSYSNFRQACYDAQYGPYGIIIGDGLGGGTCSAPSLIEPADGAVLGSHTITFRWNAVSGCTFNGYTFRVCTSPDVDNLSNCFIDTGEAGTQRTETITGRDNQDLYWGVRAANAPGGASWAVRRFRIEPGSPPPSCNPNADQVALYDDPNRNNGGSCVTLDVGNYPNPGTLGSLGNDVASSIKVGGNVQAILCENDNYQGRCETFTSDDGNLGDNYIGDNAVSSAKVQWRTQGPPAPTLQSPSNGSDHTERAIFTLVWNSAAGATEYYAEYWGGPDGTLNSGWQGGTSWFVGSQSAGYTYSWHVKARNSIGQSGWSSTWTFTVKPLAPSLLHAQTASCSQVNLHWMDNSGSEEGYKIYRNGAYAGQVGANATSYQDTGLSENTGYSYYVKAFRGSIESDASNTVNITTPPCAPPNCNPNADQIALFVDSNYGGQCVVKNIGEYPNPGSIGLPNDSISSVKIGGNVEAILCRDDDYGGGCETFINDDPNLSDNSIGNDQVSSAKVKQRVQPPAAPTLQSPGNGSSFNEGQDIVLSWSDTGDEYYGEVWGGPAGTTPFGWQSGTSKNIGSQWAGYTYSWHVKARNSAGESGWSSTWIFTVKPAAPSNLSAQAVSCSEINLQWNDNSGNEEGYKIYRNGSYVGQVGANTTSYQDAGLNENTSYSYYVRAFRGSVQSSASNTVNITTPPCAPPQPDLMPSQWGGWQYPVVPSSITGTSEVNTLYAGYPTYIDWGLTNAGDTSTGGNTYGALYIDDVRIGYYDFGDVRVGATWAFFDWVETVDTPGWHTLKSVADPDNLIDESDEGNNVFQRAFYWTATAPSVRYRIYLPLVRGHE